MSMSKGVLYMVIEDMVDDGIEIVGMFNDKDDAIKAARKHKPSWGMAGDFSPVHVQIWHQGTVQWECIETIDFGYKERV